MVIYSVPSSSSRTGVFKLLSSRANLHLSYNPAGRSHCRLQNHHGYIKHHYSGIGGASFSNPYITSPTSQFILQPFRRFTYVTAHSIAIPLLHLRHRHFTYVTTHSPILPPLHLRHSSFSNPSVALPTSQLILQPFCCFTYVIGNSSTSQLILQPYRRFIYATAHSPTLPLLHLCHSSFYNHSVASLTSQALHILHLASRPCMGGGMKKQSVVDQLLTASY